MFVLQGIAKGAGTWSRASQAGSSYRQVWKLPLTVRQSFLFILLVLSVCLLA